jgi:bisphosphoglycerate-independent phosphoglycerate mutase (AlkP superfamily)
VLTYDMKPYMSAREVTEEAVAAIKSAPNDVVI